ncbi:hypothetical protein L218DRAFT_669621 [Marasmius fiardii PR-910]|nr:hypothetical protein L218DRAFT_669621 [Marasmius fiardii PR-910]
MWAKLAKKARQRVSPLPGDENLRISRTSGLYCSDTQRNPKGFHAAISLFEWVVSNHAATDQQYPSIICSANSFCSSSLFPCPTVVSLSPSAGCAGG